MKKKALLFIILSGLFWGTSSIFVGLLTPFGFSALQITSMRATGAAVSMAVGVFLYNKKLFKVDFKQLLLFACTGITMFVTSALYYASMQAASVPTAVILMYMSPVYVMAYSVAFLGEKLTPVKVFSVLCVLLGCALVSGVFGGLKFSIWGIIAGFLSGVTFSLYNILIKVEMEKKCNPVSAMVYCYVFMCISALAVADLPQISMITMQNPLKIIPLFVLIGIFTCALPYFLYTMGLKYISAGTASALGVLEPIATTLFSIIFFAEPLSLSTFSGMVLVLGAAFILGKSELK